MRGCLKFMGIDEGLEIHHVADLPARTGLGTSSAFTVGLLLGLYALQDRMRDKHALATDAIHVEQEVLQEAVGAQDQVSAAYGGFNRINFQVDGSIEVKRVLAPPKPVGGTRAAPGPLLHGLFADGFGDRAGAGPNHVAAEAGAGNDASIRGRGGVHCHESRQAAR